MPQEGTRRRKNANHFDILVVPVGEGKGTLSFRASRWKLWLLGAAAITLVVALTLAVLMFTPVAMVVPIPNPELEQKYGRQIKETQEQLNALAQNVMTLSDYNAQLRKALGEGGARDSSAAKNAPRITARGAEPPTDRDESKAMRTETWPAAVATDFDGESEMRPGGFSMVATDDELPRSNFPLLVPTEGFVTQLFDPSRNHFGMDFAGQRGTPVFAATDGHVVFSDWTFDDGNMVIIAHGGGFMTVYKHNQALLKSAQAQVKRGEPVALLGTSGQTSLGPHLHFEVWKDGIPQDPNLYLLTPLKGKRKNQEGTWLKNDRQTVN
jgi:murein DD-endopeptidase MepM/ murein hydrolase activator NlpD